MTEILNPIVSQSKRANALDALRGCALLMMVLSGVIPREGALPAWMYHAQTPPPTHVFNPHLPGLTWVDVVFPIFLFSMGAAIPLAQSRLLEKGWKKSQLILLIFKRGLLLGTFAIFLHHIRPNIINPEDVSEKWYVGLVGFGILFFMYSRWPKIIPKWLGKIWTLGGWTLGVMLMTQLRYPDGSGFLLKRSDIILIVLTNMAVFGSLVWLFTRSNRWGRIGLLGILIALQFSATTDGGIKLLWSSSPVPWIFQFDYLKYLLIVVPGTIAGDLIRDWMQTAATNEERKPGSTRRFLMIVLLMMTLEGVLLVGLQTRHLWQTTIISGILGAGGWLLLRQPHHGTEKLLHQLYLWGIYWLALGLAFEPFQGGIKKDPATYSYFFVTAAMSIFLLITFTIIIDGLQQKWLMQILIDNGQNPMIGYVTFGNLVLPILKLTGWQPMIAAMTGTPLLGFFRGVIYTVIVALIVSGLSRLKIFWRT